MGFLEIDEEILLNVETINSIEKLPITLSNTNVNDNTAYGQIKISTNQAICLITNQVQMQLNENLSTSEKEQILIEQATKGQHEAYTKIVSAMRRALKSRGELVCLSLKESNKSST